MWSRQSSWPTWRRPFSRLRTALLIAPTRTEFAAKVALLGALAVVCAVKPFLVYVPRRVLVLAAAAAAFPDRLRRRVAPPERVYA